ncbi:hypothetical protein CLOM_g2720 [Closterium sp. NIES-68]|nr:hypothetical protein CLOM_g2720 [Closterium sp. NIES-68]
MDGSATWVVEVTKYKDQTKDALCLAIAHAQALSQSQSPSLVLSRPPSILVVHVMTEVPCSRGMELPASEVDGKSAMEHGRRLVEVMLRPTLAYAKAKHLSWKSSSSVGRSR